MNILTWTPSESTLIDKAFVQDLVLLQEPCESIIYISAFSCCISSADSPVISITVASSMPFVSIFLAISWLFFSIPFFIPFSIPSAIPSRLSVSAQSLYYLPHVNSYSVILMMLTNTSSTHLQKQKILPGFFPLTFRIQKTIHWKR